MPTNPVRMFAAAAVPLAMGIAVTVVFLAGRFDGWDTAIAQTGVPPASSTAPPRPRRPLPSPGQRRRPGPHPAGRMRMRTSRKTACLSKGS